MNNIVEQTPWNTNKGEQFETAMGFGGKNQSFYRKDSDGNEYCWMAVDANTGTVDIRDNKGESLFVIDAEQGKAFLKRKKMVCESDISDMLTNTEASKTYATKEEIADMLTKKAANHLYAPININQNIYSGIWQPEPSYKRLKVLSSTYTRMGNVVTCYIPCALYKPQEGDRFELSLPIPREKVFESDDVGIGLVDTPRFDIPVMASFRGAKGSKNKAVLLLESSLSILGMPMTIIFSYTVI